ncbi:hypothetical protein AAMO2058_001648500 [Amorphochlora amoebiformis]
MLPNRHTESLSKRGYGNLASITKRFTYDKPTYYPGPGNFSHSRSEHLSQHLRAKTIHKTAFQSGLPRVPSPRYDNQLGPGHYEPYRRFGKKYVFEAPSMAKKRDDVHPDDAEWSLNGSGRKRKEMKLTKPPFDQKVSRFMQLKSTTIIPAPGTYNPTPSNHDLSACKNVFDSKQKRYDPSQGKIYQAVPGPGSYERSLSWHPDLYWKESSNFVQKDVDRWGIPLQRKSKQTMKKDYPGPGAYNPKLEVSHTRKNMSITASSKRKHKGIFINNRVKGNSYQFPEGSSYVFASRSGASGSGTGGTASEEAGRPGDKFATPGPPRYDVNLPVSKVSHHVNHKGKWV